MWRFGVLPVSTRTYSFLPTRDAAPRRLASPHPPAGEGDTRGETNDRGINSVVAVPPAFSPVAAPVCSHSPAYTTHQHVTILESPGMPPSAPSAPGATTDDAVGSTDTPSSDTGPPLPRSKKQRGKPRQLQAPGPAQAATAVCSVVAIVTVKMIQRSFRRLRTRLEDAERAKQELEATCVSSQARIDELVKSLEEKTKELAEKERRLEQMSVEQRLSKSMASLVERAEIDQEAAGLVPGTARPGFVRFEGEQSAERERQHPRSVRVSRGVVGVTTSGGGGADVICHVI